MQRREMGGGKRIIVVSNCKKISLTNIKSKKAYYETIICSIEIFLMLYENIKNFFFMAQHCKSACVHAQLCLTLRDPMDYIACQTLLAQARILECTAMLSYRGIFLAQGLNPCLLPLLCWQTDSLPLPFFTTTATWEALEINYTSIK